METAKRVDEFTFDDLSLGSYNTYWAYKNVEGLDGQVFKGFPKVVEYDGRRFYKMSFNTDTNYICYKEAKGHRFDQRYMNY